MKCAAKTDVQASFVSHFRLMTFFFTKCKVVINCAMEIWESLDSENRISLYVNEGDSETIFNARESE